MTSLSAFLLNHKPAAGGAYTHTRIGDKNLGVFGGVYNIPDEDYAEFWQLYSQHLQSGKQEFLTERQYPDGSLVVDLDFHYSPEVESRQHTEEDIENIVGIYAEHLASMVSGDVPTYDIFVSHKSAVNMLDEKTKDGIHIFFTVRVPRIIQKALRAVMLDLLPQTLEHLPLINSWDGVLDEGITNGVTNWQLLGSRKPGNKAYEITHGFRVNGEEISIIDIGNIDKSKISVRCKDFPMVSANTSNETIMRLMSRKTTPSASPKPHLGLSAASSGDASAFIASIPAEKAVLFQTWASYCCMLIRKYRDTKNDAELRDIIHEFSRKAADCYDEAKVDDWIDKYQDAKFPEDMRFPERKASAITPEVREASRQVLAAEVFSPTPTEDDLIIKPHEDKNFTTICEKIVPLIRKVLIYCRDEWYCYDEKMHLWTVLKEPQKIIKEYLFKCIAANNTDIAIRLSKVNPNNSMERDSLVALQQQYLSLYKKVESLQTLTLVKKDLTMSICDNEFHNKLDLTAGKIVFLDGIYDIATDTFRKGLRYEDYLTYTLPYNYKRATVDEISDVKKEVMKICANEEWRFKYYMDILGYSMLQLPDKEQAAFFMVGMSAGNGKSTILEALTKMMPNYVVKLNSKTFSKGNPDFKKSINSIKGSRIAWINEVEKKTQDIDTIKDIADGKSIQNPVLFKQQEEKIQIKSKLFFVSNGEIAFASDEGIKRRYRYVEFIAKFHPSQDYDALDLKRDIDFIADKSFEEYINTENGFFALLDLILQGSRRWLEKKALDVPPRYMELARAACEKNNEFAEFFSTNIVKAVGKFVSRYDIEQRYKELYEKSMKNEKDIFRPYMMSKGYIYDCYKKVKKTQGCYMDCILRDLDEILEEE
jgi:phage/plasmid-associated DNA primase